MANIDLKTLKKLRDETAASIADCRAALDATGGDYKKALEWLKKRGIEKAEKKSGRETGEGLVESYIHNGGKIGVLVTLLCETDFVAKTDEFKQLAHEIAMQISAMNPKDTKELLAQAYIRDAGITIEQMIKSAIGKLGENITVKEFKRFEI
ncbi:MAG TPA: translation elongation factor Ts [Candidatus Saccharimonadales bacterium]|nr:translation elongation factor Ts [Candidatus Saccharimonadales bacterium]